MREIRRRTRVVGAFPDGQSCLNLAAARLRYIAGTAWLTKRYLNMRPLSATGHATRSRRLIKCAKDSVRYRHDSWRTDNYLKSNNDFVPTSARRASSKSQRLRELV